MKNTGSSANLRSVSFASLNEGFAVGENGTIIKSSDGGDNWSQQFSQSGLQLNKVLFLNPNTGWVVGEDGTILFTTNSGTQWNNFNFPSKVWLWDIFFINSTTGWIVGNDGLVLKTTNGGGFIGIEDPGISIPSKFSLYQNYPNPFNLSTLIVYEIAEYSNVNLTVFDILGREIKTIVNSYHVPGKYSIKFNAEHLVSGIYYYRLETEKFTDSKKMVLVK